MTTEEIAKAVEAWADSVLPELNTYEHQPEELAKAFPLAIAEVQRDRVSEAGSDVQHPVYQQTYMRVWTVQLMLLVSPNPTWTASQNLYRYVDALGRAVRDDRKMGGRVEVASPLYDASYDPPEIEHPDGTVARQVTMTINVGEQVEV